MNTKTNEKGSIHIGDFKVVSCSKYLQAIEQFEELYKVPPCDYNQEDITEKESLKDRELLEEYKKNVEYLNKLQEMWS